MIGVLDLKSGCAVHAVAGNRDDYRPLSIGNGDPVALVERYLSIGVTHFYVADLDSILGTSNHAEVIERFARRGLQILLDIGWRERADAEQFELVSQLASRFDNISWIVATESMKSANAINELVQLVSPNPVFLGLDYRDGRLTTFAQHQAKQTDDAVQSQDEQWWIQSGSDAGCVGAVVLDLTSIGTSSGPATAETCKRVRQAEREWMIYSGGGVRDSKDVESLLQSGCDGVLVATALHRFK